jgi:isoleucyl-tRNA synthetase
MKVRSTVMAALEEAKSAGECENPLEARVVIYADDPTRELLASLPALQTLLIVSAVEVAPRAEAPAECGDAPVCAVAARNAGEKCERCWMRMETVGSDAEFEGLCHRCAERVAQLRRTGAGD